MKILKVIIFLGLIIYWIITIDNEIRGEGIWGSFLGIIVLIAFIYGAFNLLFNNSDNQAETKSHELNNEEKEQRKKNLK